MDELVAADGNRHMRRARFGRGEKQEIAGFDAAGSDTRSHLELIADRSWQADTVLREHVLREAAAVEAVGVGAAIAIRNAPEVKRRADERVVIRRS